MDTEQLERISLGQASAEETEEFEEHLLICPTCQQRFEETESYAIAVRSAAAELSAEPAPKRSWWTVPRLVPALACLALLAIGIVTVTRFSASVQTPLAISLTATRGTAPGGTATAGRAMDLTPDLAGIGAPGPYRLEIVDARGVVTWKGAFDPASKTAAVPKQREGTHFVRVYSLQGELLREYGLEVKR
jgi:anti-sigma factor RsiW